MNFDDPKIARDDGRDAYPGIQAPFRLMNLRILDVAAPDPALFSIEDVAHALAQVNRFGGHVKWPYSVATHSVLVSFLCPPGFEYEGLMHDVTESMGLVDLPSATKSLVPAYKELEAVHRRAFRGKFCLADLEPPQVKAADTLAYWLERYALRDESRPAHLDSAWRVAEAFLGREISWRDSRDMFLLRYRELVPKGCES